MVKGQIIGGELGKILIRQKSDEELELGELLVGDGKEANILMQVYDLVYGSQISSQNLELISGMNLEEGSPFAFLDPHLRNYKLGLLKPLVSTKGTSVQLCKRLPSFFSEVRGATKEDLSFITVPQNPLFVGNLRSGSRKIDVPVSIPGKEVLSHHILIPATTGRGKSNLVKNMLWSIADESYCGILVLDPHDEYYGRNGLGLKDHESKEKVVYYTPKNPPSGARSLKFNLKCIKPKHFIGATYLTEPQIQAMGMYYKLYGNKWIESIVIDKPLPEKMVFHEATIGVLKRKMVRLLDLDFDGERVRCNGIFDLGAGEQTIKDIVGELERGHTVIIDTSGFSGSVEILIGSLITHEVFNRYKFYKLAGQLDNKPVISVVLEEAPRVLGKEVLEAGPNIFSTIAREGRKFKVGLVAITQLPSLIPRQVLANMNTKIILGIEMKPERQAVMDSAAQDLSSDDRNIASLDRGEAIITSNFTKFATPVKIPLFDEVVKQSRLARREKHRQAFEGIALG